VVILVEPVPLDPEDGLQGDAPGWLADVVEPLVPASVVPDVVLLVEVSSPAQF
jgi:hypothetical protein